MDFRWITLQSPTLFLYLYKTLLLFRGHSWIGFMGWYRSYIYLFVCFVFLLIPLTLKLKISWELSAMVAEALASCVTRSLAAVVLIMLDKRIHASHEEVSQLSVTSHCWSMMCDGNVFYIFIKINSTRQGLKLSFYLIVYWADSLEITKDNFTTNIIWIVLLS